MLTLSTPIAQINAIARKIAPQLKQLGLNTARDLLFYFPFRHEDWSQVQPIAKIQPGATATIKAKIELIQNKRSKWKQQLITEAIITDDTGSIKAVWFHQPYLVKNLKPGDVLFLSGKVEIKSGGLQLTHPNYEKITQYKTETTHTARIVPIYSLTKKITSKHLRYLISQVLTLANKIPDWLPSAIIAGQKIVALPWALKQIHFPDNFNYLNQAKDRLKFNELFILQLRAALSKQELNRSISQVIKFSQNKTRQFVQSLPYQLTNAQKIAGWEIIKDLGKSAPMNRLLEGDVGSGKTVVACLAILNTVLNQGQAAYMAPTEILAEQHFNTITKLFNDWPVTIALLTRTQKKISLKHKNIKTLKRSNTKTLNHLNVQSLNHSGGKTLYQMISDGQIDLVIGTHALIQDKVTFNNLALAIIDEQHRFGVDQRKKLKQKNEQSNNRTIKQSNHQLNSADSKNIPSLPQPPPATIPHFLSMTATPIPRSLALTAYGDLDLSIINEMPPGRQPILTEAVMPEQRPAKYQFILDQIKQGRQAFVICPLIDPSDRLGVKAVKDEYQKLKQTVFPGINIGLMHGRLKASDKEKAMADFLQNKTSLLVSTPVIEVGIDVPNATIMAIESAERFGLAQLHQFRGRVGRGQHQSYCFLFTESDSDETIKRMHALIKCDNGFELAEKDLEFRGPGEVYGIRQSGFDDRLKIAKLTDYIIIKKSQSAVKQLLAADPALTKFPLIRKELGEFEKNVHLE